MTEKEMNKLAEQEAAKRLGVPLFDYKYRPASAWGAVITGPIFIGAGVYSESVIGIIIGCVLFFGFGTLMFPVCRNEKTKFTQYKAEALERLRNGGEPDNDRGQDNSRHDRP